MGRTRTTQPALTVYGVNAVRELLGSGVPVARVLLSSGPRTGTIVDLAHRRGVPCERVDRQVLDGLAGAVPHQGVVALGVRFQWSTLDDLERPECRGLLCLDSVQDPRNLGAIVRVARAAGLGGVVLPQDRSAGLTPVVAVASAGTVFGMRMARVPNLVRALASLKDAGFWTVGLSPDAGTSLWDLDVPARPAVVVGGEGEGLRPLVRRACDFEARIPMAAGVESLNVAVAVAVALFELRRRGLFDD